MDLEKEYEDKVLIYASETWTVTKRDRKQLNVLKGKCIEEFQAQYMTIKKKIGGY